MASHCDICGMKHKIIVDNFCNCCPTCSKKHTDLTLLKRIGGLLNKYEPGKNV